LRLGHPPVPGSGGDHRRNLGSLAKSLNRDARHRVDLDGRAVHRLVVGPCVAVDNRAHCHCPPPPAPPPIGVSTVFQSVPGSWPLRTSWIARVRMATSDRPRARGWAKSRGSSTWAATTAWVAQPKL